MDLIASVFVITALQEVEQSTWVPCSGIHSEWTLCVKTFLILEIKVELLLRLDSLNLIQIQADCISDIYAFQSGLFSHNTLTITYYCFWVILYVW